MSPETVPSCPLCRQANSKPFDQRMFRGQRGLNRLCQTCGLVYQSPRMTQSELADYYEQEYRLQYQGNEGPNPKDLATQQGRAKSLLQFVEGKLPPIARHLDIGCSAGLLLSSFQQAYQCIATGIEPGTAYREYAQASGLSIYATLEDLEAAGEERYDLISMAHVLEHLPDPVEYLAHLRTTRLTPDGYLLIEVPNLYAHDCFETAHMVSYSANTLSQTLQKAGFTLSAIKIHGQPRSEVIPLYLSILAKAAAQAQPDFVPQPERQVALKRSIGMLRRRWLTKLVPKKAWLPVQST